MNGLELLIYQAVKRNPKLKNLVRDIYQTLFYLYPVPEKRTTFPVMEREGFFFGFHDKNPWSADNTYLLAHGFNGLPNTIPAKGNKLDIGFFSGENFSSFHKVASTSCFNWQQGSMLQWLGKTNTFIFNDLTADDVVARIYDAEGNAKGILPLPVAATDPAGNKALSYNFARLQRHFPGYGYVHGHDPEIEAEAPSGHGISIIDIAAVKVNRLFSVKDIASFHPEKSMNGAFHFLTHCLFSPSGKRFVFLHRWIKNENFSFTRMLSCDLNGQDLHVFPARDMVSHIAWQDESHVLAYCRSMENQDAYILFKDMGDEYKIIGRDVLNSDGHPSFPATFPGWFVTDTYPDRFRRSYLILYNLLKEERIDLGFFRQPLSYKEELRCDLHPRWNRDATMICFDSAHSGKRSLCTLNIGNMLSNNKLNSIIT